MANTDVAWERWGASDPYFGVESFKKFGAFNIGSHRDEFFSSGDERIRTFLNRFERPFGKLNKGKALDYGCGVGRLTLALAKEFNQVVGLDISQSMLKEARKNAETATCENVRFELPDATLDEPSDLYDFVICYNVIQHIPVDRGVPIILKLVDKVAPGGGFMIHFSLRGFNTLSRSLYWIRHNVPGMNAIQNVRHGRAASTPAMQMNDYPLVDVLDKLDARGIPEVLTFMERHERILTVGLVGRKPLV